MPKTKAVEVFAGEGGVTLSAGGTQREEVAEGAQIMIVETLTSIEAVSKWMLDNDVQGKVDIKKPIESLVREAEFKIKRG